MNTATTKTTPVPLSAADIEDLLSALNENETALLARLAKAKGPAETRHLKNRLNDAAALGSRLIEARKSV
jgi:hypothetical protein